MESVKPFFDYCVNEQCFANNRYESTIKLLYDYGYRTIAINQTLETQDMVEGNKKKKKKNENQSDQVVPKPFTIKPVEGCKDMKILNRLTIEFASQDVLHKIIKSPNYKNYHLIAAMPTTAAATMFTCSTFEADIFCFNPESKNQIRRTRKMCNQLIERGYHFEIPYAPAIEDRTKRINVIHASHLYHEFAKSRNIIISSMAKDPIHIRSPYDIINLGLVLGLNEQQAKNAVSHCGRQVFINSVGRRHGKAVMFVENMNLNDDSVILVQNDAEDDLMEVEPAMKKFKQ